MLLGLVWYKRTSLKYHWMSPCMFHFRQNIIDALWLLHNFVLHSTEVSGNKPTLYVVYSAAKSLMTSSPSPSPPPPPPPPSSSSSPPSSSIKPATSGTKRYKFRTSCDAMIHLVSNCMTCTNNPHLRSKCIPTTLDFFNIAMQA